MIKDDKLLEKSNAIRKKSAIESKKDLIVNRDTMKNILKLKQNLIREIPTKMIKSQ